MSLFLFQYVFLISQIYLSQNKIPERSDIAYFHMDETLSFH